MYVVDNIYESSGDNGFWSALHDLTKKARCPVFLTANSFPNGLSSASLRFRHMITCRPSPMECAKKMEQVLDREGIRLVTQHGNNSSTLKALSSVAELCSCDIRRIMHELQLFFCTGEHQGTGTFFAENSISVPPCVAVSETKENADVIIDEVSPKVVAHDKCSLLTIKGRNFFSLANKEFTESAKVFFGGEVCPAAKIVDDETILAVCPPCSRPDGVDNFGRRKTQFLRPSLQTRFAPLSLQSGLIESSPIRSISLVDDSSISVVIRCNIEYSFPEEDEDEGDIEFEGGDRSPTCAWHSSTASCLAKRKDYLSRSDKEEIIEAAEEMLRIELERLSNQSSSASPSPPVGLCDQDSNTGDSKKDDEQILERLSRDCELRSDASMLEDHEGALFLSGASPGFGYEFTPAEQSRHGNATQ